DLYSVNPRERTKRERERTAFREYLPRAQAGVLHPGHPKVISARVLHRSSTPIPLLSSLCLEAEDIYIQEDPQSFYEPLLPWRSARDPSSMFPQPNPSSSRVPV